MLLPLIEVSKYAMILMNDTPIITLKVTSNNNDTLSNPYHSRMDPL